MKADKGKHRADVISELDLLLKNVSGSTKINIKKIAASTVDKLATVSHKINVFSTPKGKLVYSVDNANIHDDFTNIWFHYSGTCVEVDLH